jgi:hypothetical protein
VECQLDALRKCLNRAGVRKALSELPATLDNTYERILTDIPKEYSREVRTVLQLLAWSCRPLTLSEIAEAVVVDLDNYKFDKDERMPDPYDLYEIIAALVSLSDETR